MAQPHPRDIVIVDAIRTPMANVESGFFKHTHASQLSACLVKHLIERNNFDIHDIEDVIWGSVYSKNKNIGGEIRSLANLAKTTGGQTINRLDGSSMQALHTAAAQIAMYQGNIFIVGGAEDQAYTTTQHNGLSAEIFARMNGITREQQDIFTLQSHQRAWQATQNGMFEKEIMTTIGYKKNGFKTPFKHDEVIQPHLTLSDLQRYAPTFDTAQGIITDATIAQAATGASSLLLMSYEYAKLSNLKPRAVVRSMAIAGCDQAMVGYGAVPATQKALKRAGLSMKNIQAIEIHESSAAETLAILKNLDLFDQQDKVNIHGGALALGHAKGNSGTRMITTLLHTMEQKKIQFGLATLSIGDGQGIATIIERV